MTHPIVETIDRFRKFKGFHTVSASWLGSAFIGPAGRRREALFGGVAGPPRVDGSVPFEHGLLKGRRHRHLDEGVGRVSTSVALERWC